MGLFSKILGIGGGSGSSTAATTSSTSNTTLNDSRQTDRKVSQGASSFNLGDGASIGDITLESVDSNLTAANIKAMGDLAGKTADTAGALGKNAFSSAQYLTDGAYDTALKLGSKAIDAGSAISRDTLATSNKAIASAGELFANAKAGEGSQLTSTLKAIAIAGIIGGAVVGSVYLYRKSK
jgi:hypothetical protein